MLPLDAISPEDEVIESPEVRIEDCSLELLSECFPVMVPNFSMIFGGFIFWEVMLALLVVRKTKPMNVNPKTNANGRWGCILILFLRFLFYGKHYFQNSFCHLITKINLIS